MESIKRGTAYPLRMELTLSEDGSAVDLTDATVSFALSPVSSPESVEDLCFKKTNEPGGHTDAENWITSFNLSASNTDLEPWIYYWELQVKFDENNIHSTENGQICILQDLNKAT